jgi:DNA-directed RNA polymerase specialized sigma24 family protein
MSKKLPQDQQDRIIELYKLGFSIRQVANRTHVSMSCVVNYLNQNNIKRRPPGGWALNAKRLPYDEVAKTVLLYKHGWSTNEIAKALGIAHSTVRFRLQKAGVPLRPRAESCKLRWERKGRNGKARAATRATEGDDPEVATA